MATGVVELSDQSFQQDIVQGKRRALVDFWAVWCGPCRMVGPVVEELAQQYTGKITIGKINVDDHIQTATQFRVMNIPTLIFFKDGQEVDRVVGVAPKAELAKKCEALLAA